MKETILTIVCLKLLKISLLGVFLATILAANTSPIKAQTVVFSDDFSQGLDKWEPTRDTGTSWQIVNGSVEATVSTRATITELVPKDQFWNSDWKDITFSYELTPLQGVDRNTSFGWESLQRWFELHFVNGILNLVRVEDGQVPLDIFEQYPMNNGQTYQVSITLRQQEISVTVNNEQIASTTYDEYVSQGGKIGLKAGTGSVYPTKVRYDNVKVIWHQGADTQLSVPMFKQHDSSWGNTIYDHGTKWSDQPTISRWGCLISSIAMVMNYHGLDSMLDGTAVTPATLNSWLTAQPDGYLHGGLVNWSAVTRLTKQISDRYGTPKLEYTRIAGADLSPSINFIQKSFPSILEVTGHFLVGKGFTNNQDDLLINDPAYTYQKLSQHSTKLKSTRLLTPSHTDLSYLVISHDPLLSIQIRDRNGDEISGLETFTETVNAISEDPESRSAVIHQIAKPNDVELELSVSQSEVGPFKLTIFAYDQAANLTDLSLTGWAGTNPQKYLIKYQKQGAQKSSITSLITWQYFQEVVTQLESDGLFLRKTIFQQLINIAQLAETEPAAKQLQRVKQLEKMCAAFSTWFSDDTRNYLAYLLKMLTK